MAPNAISEKAKELGIAYINSILNDGEKMKIIMDKVESRSFNSLMTMLEDPMKTEAIKSKMSEIGKAVLVTIREFIETEVEGKVIRSALTGDGGNGVDDDDGGNGGDGGNDEGNDDGVSVIDAFLESAGLAGAATIRSFLISLMARCHLSVGAAVRVAHGVVSSGGEGSRLTAKVVPELLSDDRVVSLFSGDDATEDRAAIHKLLWRCGADLFLSNDYETSIEIFHKSMLYVPHNVETEILNAQYFQVLCLCHLGLSQLDEAQNCVDKAEQLHPNTVCAAFLKVKICLQKGDDKSSIDQLQAMTSCHDFRSDLVTLSAHESIALLPIVFRTLITVLSQGEGNESEILKVTKEAFACVCKLGPEQFYGKGEVGRRECNWFAINSWNFGIRTGKDKKYGLCADFFEIASEFYGTTISRDFEENGVMGCRSLLLSASATLMKHKSSVSLFETVRASCMLERGEKPLRPFFGQGDPLSRVESLLFRVAQQFVYTKLCMCTDDKLRRYITYTFDTLNMQSEMPISDLLPVFLWVVNS